MSLYNITKKIKGFERDIVLILAIILVASISFGLGRLSKIRENKAPITVENGLNIGVNTASVGMIDFDQKVPSGAIVGSKNGTKYHFPWCSGAQRMKESNKVWFDSKEEAEKAGYTPASNCKGL